MHVLAILLFSSIASFIGSLQLGPVNLFVIDTTLNNNRQAAFWVACGGIIPEFIYCAFAVYSSSYFIGNPAILLAFKILLIAVLGIVGVIYLLKKHKSFEIKAPQKAIKLSKIKHFFRVVLFIKINVVLFISGY